MSGLAGKSLSLGFKQGRGEKGLEKRSVAFQGGGFACTSASLGVSAALTAGGGAGGGGHPPWLQVKGPAGLLLVDAVRRSQSGEPAWCFVAYYRLQRAALLVPITVWKSRTGDAKGFFGEKCCLQGPLSFAKRGGERGAPKGAGRTVVGSGGVQTTSVRPAQMWASG